MVSHCLLGTLVRKRLVMFLQVKSSWYTVITCFRVGLIVLIWPHFLAKRGTRLNLKSCVGVFLMESVHPSRSRSRFLPASVHSDAVSFLLIILRILKYMRRISRCLFREFNQIGVSKLKMSEGFFPRKTVVSCKNHFADIAMGYE